MNSPDSAIFCTFDVSSAGEAVFCILLHDTVSKHAAIIIANCFILDKIVSQISIHIECVTSFTG